MRVGAHDVSRGYERVIKKLSSLFAVLMMIGGAPAQANSLARMLGDSGLTQEDIDIMTAEAASLYSPLSRKVGNMAEWENATSGTTGSVEIIAIEGKCVTLGHIFKTKKKRAAQSIKMRRCQADDGSWPLN